MNTNEEVQVTTVDAQTGDVVNVADYGAQASVSLFVSYDDPIIWYNNLVLQSVLVPRQSHPT